MELIADLGEKSGGEYIFDRKYLADTVEEMHTRLLHMVQGLNLITGNRYLELHPPWTGFLSPWSRNSGGSC